MIAPRVGGIKEIIDGTNGVLLPPRRPELWARRSSRLIEDRELRREMGAVTPARRRVSQRAAQCTASGVRIGRHPAACVTHDYARVLWRPSCRVESVR